MDGLRGDLVGMVKVIVEGRLAGADGVRAGVGELAGWGELLGSAAGGVLGWLVATVGVGVIGVGCLGRVGGDFATVPISRFGYL